MTLSCAHTIHGHHAHFGWNATIDPVARVAPGETVTFECRDASDGQITPRSTRETIADMDADRVNPVTGPVFVEGAAPGDVLAVRIDGFAPSGFGWTANIPGFGLLADQFPDAAVKLWSYAPDLSAPALFSDIARVPMKPFAGTMGVAPAAPGPHSVVPPRRVGGNLDIRDLAAGTVLYLPVEVEGALFSVGDTHAAQGDGEVCGTAIESPMDTTLTFDLIKDRLLRFPRFETPGPVTRHLDAGGYDVTTGIGPDLMAGARDAVSGMIDLLSGRHGMAPVDAYMLASTCADLRISEIVDAPNWVVSFYMPRCVFD